MNHKFIIPHALVPMRTMCMWIVEYAYLSLSVLSQK